MKATLEQFTDLWKELGALGKASTYFEILQARYEEPPRAYHTLEHVGWGLKRIEEIAGHELTSPMGYLGIQWAMWFHDACMNFGGQGEMDERNSSILANDIGHEVGLPTLHLQNTRRLILATQHMEEPEFPDEMVLVDADLSILGADEKAFREYEARVRIEWGQFSDAEFTAGRLKVLERLEAKRRIFSTAYAYNRWERMARFNIGQSMARLKANRMAWQP